MPEFDPIFEAALVRVVQQFDYSPTYAELAYELRTSRTRVYETVQRLAADGRLRLSPKPNRRLCVK